MMTDEMTAGTLRSLSAQDTERRLDELRADERETLQHLEALEAEGGMAELRGDSDEVKDRLDADWAAAERRLKRIRRGIPELEEHLAFARDVEAQRAAKARITAIKRAYGSLISARSDDLARLEAAAKEFDEAMSRLNARHRDVQVLLGELLVLEHRFGVETPDLARPARPAQDDRVSAALARVRGALPANASDVPVRIESMAYEGSGWSVRTLLARLAATPTGALLNDAGAGHLGDAAAWEARRDERQKSARDAEVAQRQAEAAEVDEWLKKLLADGPLPLEGIEREAKTAGIALRVPMGEGSDHAALYTAAERLGVAAVKERTTSVTFWVRGGRYDSDQFIPLAARSGLGALRV
jgi:hypothetical protein